MAFAPFLAVVPDVPNFSTCNDKNKRATTQATHALAKKTRVDIITMNIALAYVFLECLSSQVRTSFQQQHLHEPNIVFIDMLLWFVSHNGKNDIRRLQSQSSLDGCGLASSNRFNHLVLRLFTGAAFASSAGYLMNGIDVLDIGLCVIKHSRMYMEEYKQWIACEAICPRINEDMASFKEFW